MSKMTSLEIGLPYNNAHGHSLLELALANAPRHVLLAEVAATARALGADGCRSAVLMLDRPRGCLNLEASDGMDSGYAASVQGIPVDPAYPSCGRAAATGTEIIVEDIDEDPSWEPFLPLATAHGIRAVWSFPIIGPSSTLGTIAIYHCDRRLPTPLESDELRYLASIAAVALAREDSQAKEPAE